MRVLVTGATGTVGREVCRALLARGVEVRVGARPTSDVPAVLPKVTDVVPFDFTEPPSPSVFGGIDAFFFMTPLIEDQVPISQRVLDAAEKAGVAHVVRLSSRSAGWDHQSKLRAWHRMIDESVQRSSMSSVILRPCSFFQNFIKYQAKTIRSMSSIIIPQGDGLVPYIDAMDIGEAGAECLLDSEKHDGQTYVLTGARAYGAKGVAAEIGRVIGKPIMFIDVDESAAQDAMLQAGNPPWLVEAALAVFASAKAGLEAAVDPSITELLGRPATSLSEFVERNREAWT
ncbi:MAG: NmrA family NAD(P)-binding protein [Myxococcales bacterium]|nr:NmrA family NAD(P)-binding protein [Myxococcales bacterium]MDH3484642.1 NmrA family NAD(P)-binding protein [Myxococcales bacterium]